MSFRSRRSPVDTTTESSSSSPTQQAPQKVAPVREANPLGYEPTAPSSQTPLLDSVDSEYDKVSVEPEVDTITIRPGENLTLIAERYGVTVADLLNVNAELDPNELSIGQTIRTPPVRLEVADEDPGEEVYFVRRGDNLTRIAKRLGTTVDKLAEANGISAKNFLRIGQPLRLPSVGAGRDQLEGVENAKGSEEGQKHADLTYKVRRGDALDRIAARYDLTTAELIKANGIRNANRISIGQKLVIPGAGAVVEAPNKEAPSKEPGAPERDPEAEVSQEVAEVTDLKQGKTDPEQIQNSPALEAVIAAVLKVAPKHGFSRGAIPGILRQSAASGVKSANQVAYILATADHESDFGKPTFKRSETLVEDTNTFRQGRNGKWSALNHVSGGRSRGNSPESLEKDYWDDAYGGKLGNRRGTSDASDFRGRGYVQLTGRDNYQKMNKDLVREGFVYELDGVVWGRDKPIDLIKNPDHVNRNKELAARVLVEGMTNGLFTGARLDQYVNNRKTDFYNARRVVNGDRRKNGRSIQRLANRYAGALSGWSAVFRDSGPKGQS